MELKTAMSKKSTLKPSMLSNAEISILVSSASDIIAPAWSLTSFVASNPLHGFEDLAFPRAISKAKNYFKAEHLPNEKMAAIALKKGNLNLDILTEVAKKHLNDFEKISSIKEKEISAKDILLAAINNPTDNKNSASEAFIKVYAKKLSAEFSTENTLQLKCVEYKKDLDQKLNKELIKWLELFYDEGQASFNMPSRSRGIYRSWLHLAAYENYQNPKTKLWLKNLSRDPRSAIVEALNALEVNEDDFEEYMRVSLAQLNGWVSFIKWRMTYGHHSALNKKIAPSLIDYLALRFALEYICILENDCQAQHEAEKLSPEFKEEKEYLNWIFSQLNKLGLSKKDLANQNSQDFAQSLQSWIELYQKKGLIILEALEESLDQNYRAMITSSLNKKLATEKTRKDAQLVFCIDVRSEPFRKKIEQSGNNETFGFAGFFGIPIKYKAYEDEEACDSCPVLIKPKHYIYEDLDPSQIDVQIKRESRLSFKASFNQALKDLKMNPAVPFSFAEAAGAIYAIRILLKSIGPYFYKQTQRLLENILNPKVQYQQKINFETNTPEAAQAGISLKEQVAYAKQALMMIGLTENFAPIVVFCGHGSHTENNPYASALDCGACGGKHGGPNARVLAEILNNPQVQSALAQSGIQIPADTIFVGAEHNTTDDSVEIFHQGLNIDSDKLAQLKTDLTKAQKANQNYRLKTFSTSNHPNRRSHDWSETRPEWGLAGNANFIIAPRELSIDHDLQGRSFLHSYRPEIDHDHKVLETIMTAPMIVTQWINSQYFFSTVDNRHYGSGSKVTHNVFGNIGVVQGNASDLMHGLALQSVNASDSENYHQPLRITNYIYAEPDAVKAIIDKHEILERLIYNSWIRIVVISPSEKSFYQLDGEKKFVKSHGIL